MGGIWDCVFHWPRTSRKRTVWILTNNHAERPFADLTAIWKTYPALSLHNLGWLSHSLANGAHRTAYTYGIKKDGDGTSNHCHEAGIALTAHPNLKRAVNVVCSVRRKTIGP